MGSKRKLTADEARLLERALEQFRQDDVAGAAKTMESLAQRAPDHPSVVGVLGTVLSLQGRIEEAAVVLRRSVLLSPKSELASVSLFHCEVRLGNVDAAFDEMRRLLALRDSHEYRLLLKEINESD